jgi:hypothetical protein
LCSLFLLTGCSTNGLRVVGRRSLAPRVTGIIEEPRSDALLIRTKGGDVTEVRTDPQTHYTKWLTQQPWTIDKMVTAKSVTVGSCVNVLLRPGHLRVADRVELSFDKAGAPWEPCKSLR